MTVYEVSFDDVGNAGNFIESSDYPAFDSITANDFTQTADGTVTGTNAAFGQIYAGDFSVQAMSARFYARRTGVDVGNLFLLTCFNQAGQTVSTNRFQSGGTWQVRDQTAAVYSSSLSVANDSWMRVEQRWNWANNTQDLRLFVGANLEGSVPDEEITGLIMDNRTSTTSLKQVAFGVNTTTSPVQTFEIRDVAWADELIWIGAYNLPVAGPSALKVGSSDVSAMRVGDDTVQKVYLGSNEIYSV